MFPALDERGEVAYVQTRYLEPGDGPKYDNPAGHLGTNPRLAWTQSVGPERAGQLIVCEGIPDGLTAAGSGYQAVAIVGSQAPDHGVAYQIGRRAARDQLQVTLVVDNDPAGLEWGDRLRTLLDDANVDAQIVTPPDPEMDLNAWAMVDRQWSIPEGTTSLAASCEGRAEPADMRTIEVG